MEKIFICQQCHAELGEDEVDGILGHAVPDYDEDGDVDGCNQCGPCEMNRDWALARIKSLKDCAAKMQKRILELAENEAVTSANYNGAVARIADLEAEIVERRKDYSACIRDQDARIAELEAQLAAAQERNVALQSEHLNHVNALHEQLTAMTAERDSETRWAKQYSDEAESLRKQLEVAQERGMANAKLRERLADITVESDVERKLKELALDKCDDLVRKLDSAEADCNSLRKQLAAQEINPMMCMCGNKPVVFNDRKENEYSVSCGNHDGSVFTANFSTEKEAVDAWNEKMRCAAKEYCDIADTLRADLAAAQEREADYRNALMDAAKDFNQAGMGNCCQHVMDALNRIINAAEAE